jgi:hypothetical protein
MKYVLILVLLNVFTLFSQRVYLPINSVDGISVAVDYNYAPIQAASMPSLSLGYSDNSFFDFNLTYGSIFIKDLKGYVSAISPSFVLYPFKSSDSAPIFLGFTGSYEWDHGNLDDHKVSGNGIAIGPTLTAKSNISPSVQGLITFNIAYLYSSTTISGNLGSNPSDSSGSNFGIALDFPICWKPKQLNQLFVFIFGLSTVADNIAFHTGIALIIL